MPEPRACSHVPAEVDRTEVHANEIMESAAIAMLDELARLATALQPLRQAARE